MKSEEPRSRKGLVAQIAGGLFGGLLGFFLLAAGEASATVVGSSDCWFECFGSVWILTGIEYRLCSVLGLAAMGLVVVCFSLGGFLLARMLVESK